MLTDLRFRLRALVRRGAVERELHEELTAHLAQLEQKLIARGLPADDARRRARLLLGGLEQTKEACRDARGTRPLEDLVRDVRYAWRTLARKPAFFATAVLTLALGIGALTVVFGIVEAVLLRPLDVPGADRIVAVNGSGEPSHSFPNYRDIRDRSTVFDGLFAYRIAPMSLQVDGPAERAWGLLVTGSYFDTLRLEAAAGQLLTPDHDRQAGASPYAVLSYDFWQNRLGGDPAVVGRMVRINRHPYTVVGVAPRGFHGIDVFYRTQIWVPMSMQPQIEGWSWLDARSTFNAWMAGRLKPGIAHGEADANLAAIASQLAREHRENEGLALSVSAPGLAGASFRDPVEAFGGGVLLLAGLVLLAACVNLASLLSARVAERQRELAIRLSIGASRSRIVRQLLTEAFVIAALGGLLAIAFAQVLLDALSRWRAHIDLPVQVAVNADWRVFAFALAVTSFTIVVVGLVPALRAWRNDPNAGLKGLAPSGTPRRRFGEALLAVQIALCAVLVTSSVVALRGLSASFTSPLGFEPGGLSVASVDLGSAEYSEDRGRQFQEQLLGRVAALPGVSAAAFASSIPLSPDHSSSGFYPEAATDLRESNDIDASIYLVSPGYFTTMGARLVAGREFTSADRASAPPVVIVNETFAKRAFATPHAAGRRVRHGGGPLLEIVGVVEDGKYMSLTEAPRPAVFWPALQRYSSSTVLLARSARPEGEVAREIARIVHALDPSLPVYGVGSAQQTIGLIYVPGYAAAWALGTFGALAMMLACTGVYGLSSVAVSRRRRELAIRRAVGARSRQVLAAVFRRIGGALALGALAGFAGAMAAGPILARVVPGAAAGSPLTLATALAVMACVCLASASGPARRALGVDPIRELRQD